jgi:hypothetical protein
MCRRSASRRNSASACRALCEVLGPSKVCPHDCRTPGCSMNRSGLTIRWPATRPARLLQGMTSNHYAWQRYDLPASHEAIAASTAAAPRQARDHDRSARPNARPRAPRGCQAVVPGKVSSAHGRWADRPTQPSSPGPLAAFEPATAHGCRLPRNPNAKVPSPPQARIGPHCYCTPTSPALRRVYRPPRHAAGGDRLEPPATLPPGKTGHSALEPGSRIVQTASPAAQAVTGLTVGALRSRCGNGLLKPHRRHKPQAADRSCGGNATSHVARNAPLRLACRQHARSHQSATFRRGTGPAGRSATTSRNDPVPTTGAARDESPTR